MAKRGVIMRIFDYKKLRTELYTPDIVNLLLAIREYRGKQELYMTVKPDVLQALVDVAKIQSTGASNRIEGIFTSDARLAELVKFKAEPRNRAEQEIAGYRDVLQTIHDSYRHITPTSNIILQMHHDLYQFEPSAIGGRYKASDNTIKETLEDGNEFIRFHPLSAFETPKAMHSLCTTYREALDERKIDSLLLIAMFVFDFLCVHPFKDGNGRMSRLLTLLLLSREGYMVGKYVSFEMKVEREKARYYETLGQSSIGWLKEEHDYAPFVKYYLTVILQAYQEFEQRVSFIKVKGITKPARIRACIEQSLGKVTKADLVTKCPDISLAMIEKTLSELVKQNQIQKIGSGKNTAYIWNRD